MRRLWLSAGMLLVLWVSVPAWALERSSKALVSRLNSMVLEPVAANEALQLYNAKWVREFYIQFQYHPQWLTVEGTLSPAAEALVLKIKQASLLALRPNDYHLEAINALLARPPEIGAFSKTKEASEAEQLSLELLLTDAFYLLAYHTELGKLDSESLLAKWRLDDAWARKFLTELTALADPTELAKRVELSKLAESTPAHHSPVTSTPFASEALMAAATLPLAEVFPTTAIAPVVAPLLAVADISSGLVLTQLTQAEPKHAGYLSLKKAFSKRLGMENSGPQEAFTQPIIKLGSDHPDTLLLRKMLNDLKYSAGEAQNTVFDETLKTAVTLFQEQHGLARDGSAGLFTQQALIENYYGDSQKMAVNLERWRWLPKNLGEDHIAVNVASFELQYIRDDKVFLSMKIVVGKNYRQTPLFSDVMQYMVLNPSWSVPHKIASEDILRKQQNDPTYMQSHNIDVYRGWGAHQTKVDTDEIMWSSITTKQFPFNLRQRPGPLNALGVVKFIFPNEHDVYLHDTNDKSLFSRSYRAYSSGCIRVSQPLELLYAIAEKNTNSSRPRIANLLAAGNEATVLLSTPLPVHLQYWTAWVDAEENLHYRADIYDRDKPILAALQSAFEVNN